MGLFGLRLRRQDRDWVFAVGTETLSFAIGSKGPVLSSSAYAWVDTRRHRAVGVADVPETVNRETETLKLKRITAAGGFDEPALAGQVLAHVFRKHGSRFRILAPRVVAVSPQMSKVSARDAALAAGARDVITIPATMAAAVGEGLPVAESRCQSVFVLERDWCAFTLISRNQLIATFELRGGIDELLQDIAILALATQGAVLDPDAIHRQLLREGLAGAEPSGEAAGLNELGAATIPTEPPRETSLRRGALAFRYRLAWHHRRVMASVPATKFLDAFDAPLYVFGPYARLPGLAELLSGSFGRRVVISARPEQAMVLGGQNILAQLGSLLKGV